MSIQTILLLIAIALGLGLLSDKWQRTNLLMIASILIMYWLQPETNLRFLGYWLPTVSLALIILVWAVTADVKFRRDAQTIPTLLIILAVIGLVHLLAYLDTRQLLGFNQAPILYQALPILLVLVGIPIILIYRQIKSQAWQWIAFSILIILFIFLKTPSLTEWVSRAWRFLAGQSPELASASEFQWLGYSYIAFRLLHIIRDKQTGRLPGVELNEFVAYTVFFPSLMAGPIARIDQVLDSLKQPSLKLQAAFWNGSQRIISGLFKKFVLADSLAVFALNPQNALQPTSSTGAWVLLYAYSLQIYLDFSGYTDIAIGIAYFLGIKLPENFNKPYLKPNLTQFWNNWHMTLTNWFRAYFFNPITRSLRKKKLPAMVILMITQISTMVLVGLWHGITINFVAWGAWHGLGLLAQNRWSNWIKGYLPAPDRYPRIDKILNVFGVVVTFHYVTLGWIWFVLPTPTLAWDFLFHLLGLKI